MCNDIFASYFIPAVNSYTHCDTSCLGAMLSICNSVSGRLPGRPAKLWGRHKLTGTSRARQSGLLEARRASPAAAAGWKADAKRKEHKGLPGEKICAGIRGPIRPGSASHPQTLLCYSRGGGSKLSVRDLQFCPISPSLTM